MRLMRWIRTVGGESVGPVDYERILYIHTFFLFLDPTLTRVKMSQSGPRSQLWIISKAGGLIYQSAPPPSAAAAFNAVSSNEALILAGTLHGIHAITARLDPTPAGLNRSTAGTMESLESQGFGMSIKATATGVKLVLIHPSSHANPPATLQRCYEAYADQVMKNPFYTVEMPIRVAGFDREVTAVLAS
ncbi:unnamed protein product [Jaminaea pallidilutea]